MPAPACLKEVLKSDFFFLLTLALIPIQLGKFFFQDFSFVLGIPLDYRAQTFYLSDISLILYIVFTAFEKRKHIDHHFSRESLPIIILIVFNIYLLINSLTTSISKDASLFFSLKLISFSLFSVFASKTLRSTRIKHLAHKVVFISLSWQLIVVILQFALQGSLGLWILGERAYSQLAFQVAHIDIAGRQLTRPYGTFSHPNILGAFLLIFAILSQTLRKTKILNNAIYYLAVAGVFLTFSKTAIASIIIWETVKAKNLFIKLSFFPFSILIVYIFISFFGLNQIFSIAERLQLAQAAFDISSENLIFGVGPNNFILELSKLDLYSIAQVRLLQPVHNVFLLILAETGVIGLFLYSLFLFTVSAKLNETGKIALFLILLLISTFDHFFWTIQQGQLLFWLSIAYLLSSHKKSLS